MRLMFAICLLMPFAAAAQTPPAGHAGMSMPAGDADAHTNAHADARGAMMSGMEKMNQAMAAAPMTGDPDHDFMSMMIPHHQGAIDMARVELQYGKDPANRRLARQIIAAQQQEIAVMKRWLAAHP